MIIYLIEIFILKKFPIQLEIIGLKYLKVAFSTSSVCLRWKVKLKL